MTENTEVKLKRSRLSLAVFIATVIVTIISLTSVIFPALVVRLTSDISDNTINPFEPGVWAIPFCIINLILLVVGVVHYKKKLPSIIQKSINFILNFEISSKMSLIVIAILLTMYIGLSVGELLQEETWDDYEGVKVAADEWTVDGGKGFALGFKYFLLHSSLVIFNNIRVIPFISSISLLIVTYFTTVEITKKRFSGIVALIILLQSNNFLTYDASATYSSFWIFFYILSLFLICKKWYLSPISYIFSIFTKGITVIFLPMTLFFIFRSEIPKKKKILAAIPYIIILSFFAASSLISIPSLIPSINIHYYDFWNGFTSLAFQLRFDGLILMFLLPLVVGLFVVSRRGVFYADTVLILIMGALLSAPLLSGLTDYTLQPYRQICLVVFFAMGAGMIFSKKSFNEPSYLPR